MKINGKNIKGVKETVGRYNKIPAEQRSAFNIWYDNVDCSVMLIRYDIFNQCNMGSVMFTDNIGNTYYRYDDITDIIKHVYWDLGRDNISMAMLRSVLSQYIV